MPSSQPTSDISIDEGTISITSGLFDTDDGVTLRVSADPYPRVHLTPQGQVKTGDGTAPPVPFTTEVTVVSDVPTNSILGRTSPGTGDSENLSPQEARALLSVGRAIPPASVYTSGTGRGTPVFNNISRSTQAISLGTFFGGRVDVDGAFTRIVFNVTATNLTGVQPLEIACFDIGTDGLPTGTPVWTQLAAVGTATGLYDVACAQTLEYGQLIGILNPSTNAGTCTISTCNPIRSFWTSGASSTLNGALIAVSQGATMPDVSSYVINNAGVAAEWTTGTTAPFILVR